MSDSRIYEATTLDWNSIKSLATQAAKETQIPMAPALGYVDRTNNKFIDVCGPHWLLDHRWENSQAEAHEIIEEDFTVIMYALMPNGDLFRVSITDEFKARKTENGYGWQNRTDKHTIHPMDDHDIESFDFARIRYERGQHSTPQGIVWGEGGRGPLLQQAKGLGLLQILQDLRANRILQHEGLVVPGRQKLDARSRLPQITRHHRTPNERAKIVAALEDKRHEEFTLHPTRQRYERPVTGKALGVTAIIALIITVAIMKFNKDDKSADDSSLKPITTKIHVVNHLTADAYEVNKVIQNMEIGSCWNGRWSWSESNNSYMPISIPAIIDCSSPDATQTLYMVSDNCRGSGSEMALTQRVFFDGKAHCLLLIPGQGMCLPAIASDTSIGYSGIPVVCDTPSGNEYQSLMHLVNRLANANESCDTDNGYYYAWFNAVNSGFCYTVISQ